jgi:hypothetical protein
MRDKLKVKSVNTILIDIDNDREIFAGGLYG